MYIFKYLKCNILIEFHLYSMKRKDVLNKDALNELENISYNLYSFKAYYRVMYDTTNYGLISNQLVADHTQISVNNRAQLMDDALTLALQKMVSYSNVLDLTLYLGKEQAYTPWHAALAELDYVNRMMANSDAASEWKVQVTCHFVNVVFKY